MSTTYFIFLRVFLNQPDQSPNKTMSFLNFKTVSKRNISLETWFHPLFVS